MHVVDIHNVSVWYAEIDTRSKTRTYKLKYQKLFLKGLLFYKIERKKGNTFSGLIH